MATSTPTESTTGPDVRASESHKKPRRWWKLTLRFFIALICVAIGLTVWGKISFDRIERRAVRISEVGVSLNKFLKAYADYDVQAQEEA